MKLVIVLIIAAGLQVTAKSTEAQNVTISGNHITLEQMFSELREQTGFQFFYKNELIKLSKPVSMHVTDMPLKKVLEMYFQDQPLTYAILDNKIIVVTRKQDPKEIVPEDAALAITQNTPVTGTVKDSVTGNSLAGVTIQVKGTTIGTVTDAEGRFHIDAPDNAVLVVSYLGYNKKEIRVNGRSQIDVALVSSATGLGQVVITGYQDIEKKRFSGAATKLAMADVKVEGQVDVSRMLQGKAAGVSVQNVSGTFGSAPRIRIRGATSLTGDNKPLWVVDGVVLEDIVPISNDQLSSGDPVTLLGSSVAGLNANDIESFDILKDAAATALYGGRAMNGVIVVTTKRGKEGAPRITYSTNLTTSLKPNYRNYNIMNSADQLAVYAEMEHKGWLNMADIGNRSDWGVYGKMYALMNTYDPKTGTFALANTPDAKDQFLRRFATANTDWFDVLFRNQFIQEHNLSFTSGTSKSQTFASLSYYGDNGWSIADKVDRVTFNINNNFNINDRLSTRITLRGSYRSQRAPGANSRKSNTVNGQFDRDFDINPFSYALNTSRALTPYDDNGNLEYFQMNFAPFNIINELRNNYLRLHVMDVTLQGQLNYKISNDFAYSFLGAGRIVNTNTETIINENSNAAQAYRAMYTTTIANANEYTYKDPDHPNDQPVTILPQGGFYNKAEIQMRTYNIRNTLTFAHTYNNIHYVNALVGQEIRSFDRINYSALGPGYQYGKGGVPFIDYRFYKKYIEENNFPYSMQPTYERDASFFASVSYSFENKYNAEASFRYDGGNKLGRSRTARWLPTANVAASWNLDQSDFIKNIPQINSLKLRVSYGLTGSLGQATNAAAIYRSGTSIRPYLDEKETVLRIEALENQDLTWEKQNKFDAGVDGALFQNRLRFTADYYYNASFDLIDQIKTTGIGGEYTKMANNADLIASGVEVSVNGDIVANKDWLWTVGVNFGTNYNKITRTQTLPEIWNLIQASGGNFKGYPVSSLFAIDFQDLNEFSGLPSFINENGDVSNNVYFQARQFTNTKGEEIPIDQILVYQGPTIPPLTGGLNSYLKWKNLALNIFVNYQAGNKILLDPIFKNAYTDLDAFPREFDDRFVEPGDQSATQIPIIMDKLYNAYYGATNLYNAYNYSTQRVAKGDFIRLQTISLQYNLPQSLIHRLKVHSISVIGTANNVWLIYADPKLNGQDPEFFNTGGVATPVNKQFTFTLRVGF